MVYVPSTSLVHILLTAVNCMQHGEVARNADSLLEDYLVRHDALARSLYSTMHRLKLDGWVRGIQ